MIITIIAILLFFKKYTMPIIVYKTIKIFLIIE